MSLLYKPMRDYYKSISLLDMTEDWASFPRFFISIKQNNVVDASENDVKIKQKTSQKFCFSHHRNQFVSLGLSTDCCSNMINNHAEIKKV